MDIRGKKQQEAGVILLNEELGHSPYVPHGREQKCIQNFRQETRREDIIVDHFKIALEEIGY